jgi:hypothetical protein
MLYIPMKIWQSWFKRWKWSWDQHGFFVSLAKEKAKAFFKWKVCKLQFKKPKKLFQRQKSYVTAQIYIHSYATHKISSYSFFSFKWLCYLAAIECSCCINLCTRSCVCWYASRCDTSRHSFFPSDCASCCHCDRSCCGSFSSKSASYSTTT